MSLTKKFLSMATIGLGFLSLTGCAQHHQHSHAQALPCNSCQHSKTSATRIAQANRLPAPPPLAEKRIESEAWEPIVIGHISDKTLTEPRTTRVYRHLDDDAPILEAPIRGIHSVRTR